MLENQMKIPSPKLLQQRFQKSLLIAFLLTQLIANSAWAAPPTVDTEEQNRRIQQEEQNRRARQEDQDRRQREQQKDIFLQKGRKATDDTSLPDEATSFIITTLRLEGDSADRFPWAQRLLDKYMGRKIGMQGINIIVKRLSNAFIDRGYITTRVVVPEQDLSTGTLKLVLIPGRISAIRLDDKSTRGNWHNAFPAHPGDLLNLRHLEQGLEQMKRVPSQDVDMQLVPGKNPGESDVVLTVKRSKPYKLVFSADDSGTVETGKIQMAETFSLDNLFGLNDLFSITKNGDGDRAGSIRGTRGDSVYYSVPYGDSTFSFSSSRYRYHQTITTLTQPFLLSGENNSMDFHLTQLLHRDQSSKTNLECGISKQHLRSYIEDTEIASQPKDTTAVKIGLSHRHYFGQTTLDLEIDNKRGVGWFGAQADPQTPGQPTTRYTMWLLDTNLTTPVTVGKIQGHYKLTFHSQYTNDLIYQTDMISLGNRYTVRGFDGEQTLSAEKGWYLRNELALPVGTASLEAYAGLDYGVVYGPNTQNLPGRILAGSVLGLRGGSQHVQYDLFVGWPLKKPDGLATGTPTYGFQFSYQI